MARLRALLYARVSTEEQTKKYGLDSQLTALRAWCTANDAENAGEYVDRGVSGGTLDRPELTRLRKDVKVGRGDVVVVPEPSRLSRVHHEQIGLRVELRKRVRVVYLTLPTEDSAAGELLENITSAIGQFEKAELLRKTHSGRLQRATTGKRGSGRPAFGIRVGKDGRQEPNPTLAPVVQRLFSELDGGATLSALLRELANLGLRAPRGGVFTMSTLHSILTNRIYIGEGIYNRRRNRGVKNGAERDRSMNPEKDWIRFEVPPIVSRDLFDRVQARLAANAKERAGREGDDRYTLRRLLWCPVCRRHLVTHSPKPSTAGKRYRYYVCQGHGGCGRRMSAPVVEAALRDTFRAILSNPALLESKLEAEALRRGVLDVELRSAVDHAAALLAKVDREVANLEDLVSDPELRSSRVEAKLRDARGRQRDLAASLADSRAALARVVPDPGLIRSRAAAYARKAAKLADGDNAGWLDLFHALMRRVTVDGRTLRVEGALGDGLSSTPPPGGGRRVLSNPPVHRDVLEDSTNSLAYALSLDPGQGFDRASRAVLAGGNGP